MSEVVPMIVSGMTVSCERKQHVKAVHANTKIQTKSKQTHIEETRIHLRRLLQNDDLASSTLCSADLHTPPKPNKRSGKRAYLEAYCI